MPNGSLGAVGHFFLPNVALVITYLARGAVSWYRVDIKK